MRPGPPLDVLSGAVAVGVEVSAIRGRRVLATSIPVRAVKLEVTTSRTVPGQVTFEAPRDWAPTHDDSPLGNFGQRVQVVALIDHHGSVGRVELGWFQINDWKEGAEAVSVTALDLMQTLEEDPFAWGSSPAAGATLRSEAQRLAGSLPVILDDGVPDSPISSLTQWGTSRTEAIRDLCAAQSVAYRVGADAALHIHPIRDAREPQATYTARDLLVGAPRSSVKRRPNRVYVTGSRTEGSGEEETVTRWTGTAIAAMAPYHPSEYGWVTDHREFNAATGGEQVQKAADTYMRDALAKASSRSLEIIPDPRIETGDVIAAVIEHDDGATEHLVGRVTAYSLPVGDPDGTMRVDMEELAW